MAIEAPVSKFKKTNLKIYIVACVAFAIWFGYDGYFNKEFIEKHKDAAGNPVSTLAFNQKSPPLIFGAAVLLAGYLFVIKNRKLIAGENELVFSERSGEKKRISYDLVQKIDKTYFDSKGHFVITYKDKEGKEVCCKISDRTYDNLAAVLDHLVAKIS